ncbi:MAG: hypothetical protein IPJ03_06120 [Ignavibacteriales bacterium]|nr:hypothetical protein [Ignavibacteriales bacterium]
MGKRINFMLKINRIIIIISLLLISFPSNSQEKLSNVITIKLLKIEQTTNALYIESDFTNQSLNHLDEFFLNIYVYDKNNQYLGRTIMLITNLPANKHVIETIYFKNVLFDEIKKWEFVLDKVLTIKNKEIEYHDDYIVKLIK